MYVNYMLVLTRHRLPFARDTGFLLDDNMSRKQSVIVLLVRRFLDWLTAPQTHLDWSLEKRKAGNTILGDLGDACLVRIDTLTLLLVQGWQSVAVFLRTLCHVTIYGTHH